MCGIFGFYQQSGASLDREVAARMGDAIRYRGPDDQGIFWDHHVALGNQRLAVIDIDHGHQPFYSEDYSVVVVQNGEVFNFVELREELKRDGLEFQTGSDTEVILRGYERWGLDVFPKLNGMFAIAIYDQNKKELFLARDRAGEKPLYWIKHGSLILFASEIKSLFQGLPKTPEVDETAMDMYLQLGFVPPPRTLFRGVQHVLPGQLLSISHRNVRAHRWWTLSNEPESERSEDAVLENVGRLLSDAVNIRMRTEVPLGAFLSGGLSSGLNLAMMREFKPDPIKCFTVSFPHTPFDECAHALEVAKKFNTECEVLELDHRALKKWPTSIWHCDQPHGDTSFLAALLLSERAARDIKVVLTGDGADELFAGHHKALDFARALEENPKLDTAAHYLQQHGLMDRDASPLMDHFEGQLAQVSHLSALNQYLYLDFCNLLPGNGLIRPDRMGSAHSLEGRAPFVDHRLVEYAFKIPPEMKIRGGECKYLLKKLAAPLLGSAVVARKKRALTVPITEWGELPVDRWATDLLLSPQSLLRTFVDGDEIQRTLEQYRSRPQDFIRKLRVLVSLELWLNITYKEHWPELAVCLEV